jgi:predicted nucleic acid-binding protein
VILVDTCVWIDHLHAVDNVLAELLDASDVCTHPMVIGELALGGLKDRADVVQLLRALPSAMPATVDEVLLLVERETLFGKGLSLVDAHLLATARINPGVAVWTRDRRLRTVAAELGLAAAVDGMAATTR